MVVGSTKREVGGLVRPRVGLGGFPHLADEPVAPFRYGLDVPMVLGGVPERSPQREHVIGEVALFDERVRPDFLEELVFRDEAAGSGGQRRQYVERLGRQRNRTPLPQQDSLGHVEREVTKLQASPIAHRLAAACLLDGGSEDRERWDIPSQSATNREPTGNKALSKTTPKTWRLRPDHPRSCCGGPSAQHSGRTR